ncbi:MAG: DUF3592 domain-containing protein [Verrucomicrobia bacterium]|nr:DUF3592 domain-containing protein [Verrucomicrobiota bacterium]
MPATNRFRLSARAGGGRGSAVAVLFFAVFFGMGLLFVWLVGRDFVQGARTRSWPATECDVLSSRVAQPEGTGRSAVGFVVEVEYSYSVAGQVHTSRRVTFKNKNFADYAQAQRLADRYPADTKAVCYVNPAAPDEAVLQRPSLWMGLTILFPLLFVAIGGGGLYFVGRGALRRLRGQGEDAAAASKPLSDAAGSRGPKIVVAFLSFFVVVGLVAFYFVGVRPAWSVLRARDWIETPCVVLSSEVRSHSSSMGGRTYSVAIFYRYEVNGREHRSNRYKFMTGSSSGYEGKAAVVRRFPPDAKTVCWVNPRDPGDAVLERGFTGDMWFGLVPLLFVLLPGLVLWGMGKANRKRAWEVRYDSLRPPTALARARASALAGDDSEALHRVLKPGVSRGAKLVGAILVAAFWNGIVSVFVTQVVRSWLQHRPEWLLTVFMLPFVAIGLVMIGYVFYVLLGLFNPVPRLIVSPGSPALGGTTEVTWELRGRTSVLRGLRVFLEGREEATYRRGTSTSTDKHVFATLELAGTTDRRAMGRGTARVTIPAGLMHSWEAPNNKIVWALRVEGDIQWWPDVKEEFPVTVGPQKPVTKGQP